MHGSLAPGVLLLLLLFAGSTTSDWIKLEGYTYSVAEKSFTEYHPRWTDVTSYGFRFTFRTFKASTFLAHHEFAESKDPSVLVTLSSGSVVVSHVYNGIEESVTTGKGEYILRPTG